MPDKVITQKPVGLGDLSDCHLYLVEGAPKWSAVYTPKDATGAPVGEAKRTHGGDVIYDARLWGWVADVVVVAINQQEGTA